MSEDIVWFALRTYHSQESKVGLYLTQNSLTYFIPMRQTKSLRSDGSLAVHEQPFVHNLIFLRKTLDTTELKKTLCACPYPVNVYSHQDSREHWHEIPDSEMLELRIICDNTFCEPQIITQQEYDLKEGRMVRVVHGPMKGVRGKLVRKNKKYYLLKSIADVGVSISVSRWCCEADDATENN